MDDEPAKGWLRLGPFQDLGRGAALLAVGFLPWASYSLSIGLGFVKVEVEQYAIGALYTLLYVGIVLTVVMATAVLAAYLVDLVQWPDWTPQLKRLSKIRYTMWIVAVVVVALYVLERNDVLIFLPGDAALWTLGALFVTGVVEVGFRAVAERHLGRFVWRCAYGAWTAMTIPIAFLALLHAQHLELSRVDLVLALFLIAVPTVFCILQPPLILAPTRPRKRLVAAKPAPVTWKVGSPRQLVQRSDEHLVLMLVMTFLFAGATTGIAVLPHVDSELGGAKPREAYLMLSPADVDIKARAALFAGNTTESQSVNETQIVKVLFRNENLFFVRVPPNDTAGDPSYELSSGIIRGVRWIN